MPNPDGTFFKGPRVTRKQARAKKSRTLAQQERINKERVRERDGHACRFPFCRCQDEPWTMKASLTVSHDIHKGAGGDPTGERSRPELMICLCKSRHQDGRFSRHQNTIRTRYLTEKKNDGPVAWEVLIGGDPRVTRAIGHGPGKWFEFARERAIRQWEIQTPLQQTVNAILWLEW